MAGVLGALLLLLVVPGTGLAQQYPPESAELAVSTSVAEPGDPITVSGDGYMPGTTVTMTFESTPVVIGVVQADASGRFTTQVRIPEDAAPGAHTIRATGLGANGATRVLSARITVAGAEGAGAVGSDGAGAATAGSAQPSRGRISFTGADIARWAGVAFVLIVAGGSLIIANRRRARSQA